MTAELLAQAVQFHQTGALPQAEALYRQILSADPNHVDALHLSGILASQLGKHDPAISSIRAAIARAPQVAVFHTNLGIAYQAADRMEEAVASFREAVRLQPDAPACFNLATALKDQNRWEDAIAGFDQALRLNPYYYEAHLNRGVALAGAGRFDEAILAYRQSLQLQPNRAEAHNNLGNAFQKLCRLDEAAACFQEAVRLRPDYAEAHFNLALAWLLGGNFAEGWPEYEWRWRNEGRKAPVFEQPLWDGSPLAGKTIFVHAEQGFGDGLQFIRYAPLLRALGARVLVGCRPPLVRIFRQAHGVDQVIAVGEVLPPFDVHAPLLSLPRIFRTTLATIPAAVPYLNADPTLARRWREELSSLPGLKIGIAWQGRLEHKWDRQRSLPLKMFAALANLAGVRLFSLQVGPGSEHLDKAAFPITPLGHRFHDFADTAAALSALDLVVTVDTAIAHLAGGLGVPAWVLLPFAPDWRWLLGRADSPWYPGMRLFRQRTSGDWQEVLGQVQVEVQKRLANMRPAQEFHSSSAKGENTPAKTAELLAQAVQLHQASAWPQAEALYRQILDADPNHTDALHLLGVLASQLGQHDLAISSIQGAVARAPHVAVFHTNLGIAYQSARRLEEAVISFGEAVRLQPDAPAWFNLGTALKEQGRWPAAIETFDQALRLNPRYYEAQLNRGVALAGAGRFDEASAAYGQALELEPNRAEAHNNLGNVLHKQFRLEEAENSLRTALRLNPNYAEAHFNLGNVLLDGNQVPAAIASFREALRLKPNYSDAWSNLGHGLHLLGELEEARRSLEAALRAKPEHAAAHYNLGNVLRDEGKLDAAAASFRQALRFRPEYAEAHSNLGNILKVQGKLTEALACYEEAVRLQPEHATALFNRSLVWLLLGDFRRGWQEYERRWQQKDMVPRKFNEPHWDGSELAGRTILLHAEQGLGDTLQFIRYAPLVKQRGGRVVVECQRPLVALLRRTAGIDELIESGTDLPPFDVQAPLMSLPGIFGTELATIPAVVPYLHADAERIAAWSHEVGGGFKIGIAWQGSREHRRDRHRSVPLTAFKPIAALPGVRLFSLQVGSGVEQLAEPPFAITAFGERFQNFDDTAAPVCVLDLVITVDSALAHLAGGLGIPVWVALPFAPDWRWLLDREDSPWYPTMRLFRQRRLDEWQEVFERIAEACAVISAQPLRATSEAPQ